MGHAISNLALGVGQSFLCRREGWVMCFLPTTFPNAPDHPPSPPPILFDQSLNKPSFSYTCLTLFFTSTTIKVVPEYFHPLACSRRVDELYYLNPSSSFCLFFFPSSIFRPHSTIWTPVTGYSSIRIVSAVFISLFSILKNSQLESLLSAASSDESCQQQSKGNK